MKWHDVKVHFDCFSCIWSADDINSILKFILRKDGLDNSLELNFWIISKIYQYLIIMRYFFQVWSVLLFLLALSVLAYLYSNAAAVVPMPLRQLFTNVKPDLFTMTAQLCTGLTVKLWIVTAVLTIMNSSHPHLKSRIMSLNLKNKKN